MKVRDAENEVRKTNNGEMKKTLREIERNG